MSMTRNEKKMLAAHRAAFALKQKFERIDWEEDILKPELEKMKSLGDRYENISINVDSLPEIEG